MSNFIIKGGCDDVLAQLKSTLKAQDAKFEATLQSRFNLPAAPPRHVKPTPTQQKPATAPTLQQKPGTPPMPQQKQGTAFAAPAGRSASLTGSTTGSLLSSKRSDDNSVRGRLRSSLRNTPSR